MYPCLERRGVVPHKSECIIWRSLVALELEELKGSLWLLPYWQAEQKGTVSLQLIFKLQDLKTWNKILAEGWPNLLCQSRMRLGFIERLVLLKKLTWGWDIGSRWYSPCLLFPSNNSFFVVLSFTVNEL